MDNYRIDFNQKLSDLQSCQKEKNLESCLPCEKWETCEIRNNYVSATYKNLSKGVIGKFDF